MRSSDASSYSTKHAVYQSHPVSVAPPDRRIKDETRIMLLPRPVARHRRKSTVPSRETKSRSIGASVETDLESKAESAVGGEGVAIRGRAGRLPSFIAEDQPMLVSIPRRGVQRCVTCDARIDSARFVLNQTS